MPRRFILRLLASNVPIGDLFTDGELLRRFTQDRDSAALELLIRRHATADNTLGLVGSAGKEETLVIVPRFRLEPGQELVFTLRDGKRQRRGGLQDRPTRRLSYLGEYRKACHKYKQQYGNGDQGSPQPASASHGAPGFLVASNIYRRSTSMIVTHRWIRGKSIASQC